MSTLTFLRDHPLWVSLRARENSQQSITRETASGKSGMNWEAHLNFRMSLSATSSLLRIPQIWLAWSTLPFLSPKSWQTTKHRIRSYRFTSGNSSSRCKIGASSCRMAHPRTWNELLGMKQTRSTTVTSEALNNWTSEVKVLIDWLL